MKNAWPYAMILSLGFTASAARGDDDGKAQMMTQPLNFYLQTDAEGTPLNVLHPELAPLSKTEIQAIEAENEKRISEKNWLMRIYAQRMQMRAAAHPDAGSSLFQALSTNKDLAHLAGINNGTSPNPTTSSPLVAKSPADARVSHNGTLSAPPSYASYQFKPLVAPPTYGLQNYYGNPETPSYNTKPSVKLSAKPTLKSAANVNTNTTPSDIDTPGMLAAKDGALNLGSPDLTLDLLPGETMTQARIEQANAAALALPSPKSADPLPTTAKSGATNSTTNPAIPVAKIARDPADDPSAPMPVSKAPVITPGHPEIADPFSVLNR